MKILFRSIAMLSICSILLGCAGTMSGTRSSYDEFEGVKINEMTGNTLPSGLDNYTVALNARQEIHKNGIKTYFLTAQFVSVQGGAFFIAPGESLILLIDGERFSFQRMTVGGRWSPGVSANLAIYQVKQADIRRIANAKEVKARIIGNGTIEKTLTERNIQNFKKFMAQHIDASE